MPKPRLITIGPSHYCEKARWALDLAGIEYVEKAHAPVLHYAATLIAHIQRTVPILITERATIGDSTAILHYADASMEPGRRLFPTEQPALREVEELEELFDRKLGPSTRRVAYFHLLYDAERTRRVVGSGISPTERLAFRLARPAIVALMRRGLKINTEQANRSEQRISAVFDDVDARLSHGSRYLVANRLTAADLTFAALAAPVLLPPEYGWPLPPLEEASTEARALAERLRARPAGIFGMRLYRQERHGANLGHHGSSRSRPGGL